MIQSIKKYLLAKKQINLFKNLPPADREIVFFSEGKGYYTHFQSILEELNNSYSGKIAYLTSEIDDPVLNQPATNINPFFIGNGMGRTFLFPNIEAKIMIMTMPDIETFFLKKSPYVNEYIYVHHSMVSSHMIYTKTAFRYFDSIFCVGPHHIKEIKKMTELYNWKSKNLIEHGYGRLELIINDLNALEKSKSNNSKNNNKPHILIAPSWGEDAILERLGVDWIEGLLKDYFVTLRPHPHTTKKRPDIIQNAISKFGSHINFKYDNDMNSKESLISSDLMISDWSGAALEYAFARLKPVAFIDVPKKINNKDYIELEITPIEEEIREKIGVIIPESEIGYIQSYINQILSDNDTRLKRIEYVRSHTIFNLGKSGKIGAKEILKRLESLGK